MMTPRARKELLAVPLCGVRVVRRLEAIGVRELADLRGRDPYEVMEHVNVVAGWPIWRPPMAIHALSNVIAASEGRLPPGHHGRSRSMEVTLETLVARANEGDRDALEEVVRAIQDRIYGLALRMLWHPDDAADATQEILLRIVTHLGTLRGESAFMTWAYRVASNFLLTTRKRRAEREELTFERFGAQLDEGLSDAPLQAPADVEERLLVEEMKIGCTHGMLLCLDRDQRLAYILGEICEVTSEEGSYILGISPAAFRKRLSRARARLQAFMQRKCGLINPANPCRCARRVNHAIQVGRIDPQRLLFAGHPVRAAEKAVIAERVREMHDLESTARLFRSHPTFAAPAAFVQGIRKLVESGRFAVLS